MDEIEKQLSELLERLQKIAHKNKDEFRYRLEIDPAPRRSRYTFVVKECADGHAFLVAIGGTVTEAVRRAHSEIPAACESWGYKE